MLRPGDLGRLPRERTAHVFDGVPAKFRDRAPEDAARRRRRRRVELRRRPAQAQLRHRSDRGRADHDKKLSGLRFDEILPGNYDGAAHVDDMATRRRRRVGRLPEQRDLHLRRARPRARARVHALVQRLGPRRVPGCAHREHIVGLPMLPVDDGIDVCIAELDRCLAKGCTGRVHPRLPSPAVPRPVLRPAVRARRRAPGCRSRSTARSAASRPRPTTTSWSSRRSPTAGTVYRFFAAVRPVHVHGDGRRVRSSSGTADRRRRGELRLAAVLGPDDGAEPRHPRRPRRRDRATSASPTELLGRNLFVTVLDDYVGLPAHAGLPVARRRVDVLHRLSAQRHAVAELARAHRRRSPPTLPTRRDAQGAGRERGAACSVSEAAVDRSRAFALGDGRTVVPEPDVKAALRGLGVATSAAVAIESGTSARRRHRLRRPARGEGVRAGHRAQDRPRRGAPRRRTPRARRTPWRACRRVLAGHGITPAGFLVEEQCEPSGGVELLAGVVRREPFGLVVALGLGGTLAEAFAWWRCACSRCPPPTRATSSREFPGARRARRVPRQDAARPRCAGRIPAGARRCGRTRRPAGRRARRAGVQPGAGHR